MTHPPLIWDHWYTTNYAGIDPKKALCTFAHVDAPPCGQPRDQHGNVFSNSVVSDA